MMEEEITEEMIMRANLQEMFECERITEEQRRKDLEERIGTFQECLIEWLTM